MLVYCGVAFGAGEFTAKDLAPSESVKEQSEDTTDVDNVDPYSGNLTVRHQDLELDGPKGLAISIQRTYNLRELSAGLRAPHKDSYVWTALGAGWRIDAVPVLTTDNTWRTTTNQSVLQTNYYETGIDSVCLGKARSVRNGIRLRKPSGEVSEFSIIGLGRAKTEDNWLLTCSGWQVNIYSPSGIKYEYGDYKSRRRSGVYHTSVFDMSKVGPVKWAPPMESETYINPIKASDVFGNWLSYSYYSQGQPLPVINTPGVPPPLGMLCCNTTSNGSGTQYEGRVDLLSRIDSSDGRQVVLNYNPSNGRLISVRDNAGRVINYEYTEFSATSGGFLRKVILPAGRVWQYEYQPGAYTIDYEKNTISPLNNFTVANRKLKKIIRPSGGEINYDYSFINLSANIKGYNGDKIYLREERIARRYLSTGDEWRYSYLRGGLGGYDSVTIESPYGVKYLTFTGMGYSISNTRPGAYNNTLWRVGRVAQEKYSDSNYTSYTWAPILVSNETKIAYELGVVTDLNTWSAVLDSQLIVRDGATYKTRFYNYDEYGNPGAKVEDGPNGESRTTTYTYYNDPVKWIIGKLKSESSSAGYVSREFDANGNVLSEDRNGLITRYSYDGRGELATKIVPGGSVYAYSNYKLGIPQQETHPEGISLIRTVDDAGNVVSETDGEGHATHYSFDGLGRITSIIPPIGNETKIEYTSISKISTRGGLVEETRYDPFGHVESVVIGGIAKKLKHDGLGRKVFESDMGVETGTEYTYDALDRIVKKTNSDGSQKITTYGPSSVSVTGERGAVNKYKYRSYGSPNELHIMSVETAERDASLLLERNSKDLLVSASQYGKVRTYSYDDRGFLVAETNPETGETLYERDISGNMISKAVDRGDKTIFSYDGLNRLVKIIYPGNAPSISNTYNKNSKIIESSSLGGNRYFKYDASGSLIEENLEVDGLSFSMRYLYNNNNQLYSMSYPLLDRVVYYNPDVLGRPTVVSGYVDAIDYWPSGLIKKISYANGVQTSYEQNVRAWPSTFTTKAPDGRLLINSSYSYDVSGNLLKISDFLDSGLNRIMGYDKVDRLISVSGPWGEGSISYDGVGNIAEQIFGQEKLSYTYDLRNRLVSVDGSVSQTYGYDNLGNVIASGRGSYKYDGVPNLVCVNCDSPGKVEYRYDALNQRVSVQKLGSKKYEMHDSSGNLLVELDRNPLKVTEYFYLAGKRIAQRVTE